MRALVIGYGSIGSRHARLLDEIGFETAVFSSRQIDFKRSFNSLEKALNDHDPNYVVIANTTDNHYATLKKLSEHNFRGFVLVEKPLFSTSHRLPSHDFAGVWLGYNLRFHPIIQYVKKWMTGQRAISANAYVGQYLPEWRSDTDYRKSYSAKSAQGGGVLRDLSHELDYLGLMFGSWRRVAAIGGQFSTLEISSDDQFSLLIESERCSAITLQISYLDRVPQRYLTINTNDKTIIADFVKCNVIDNGNLINFSCERDTSYLEMHRAVLDSRTDTLCSIEEGLEVMDLIFAAEKANEKMEWVWR
jgi:predicted dehydrogenase